MEKISIPWKTVKGTLNHSLLKSFGKIENYEFVRKWQKVVEINGNYLCSSVTLLVEDEKNALFLLKTKSTF